eukprot:1195897-Prorocentrum_minimum.AAC.2
MADPANITGCRPEHYWVSSRTLLGVVQNITGCRPEHYWVSSRALLEHYWVSSRTLLGVVQNITGCRPEHYWVSSRTLLGVVQNITGCRPEHYWVSSRTWSTTRRRRTELVRCIHNIDGGKETNLTSEIYRYTHRACDPRVCLNGAVAAPLGKEMNLTSEVYRVPLPPPSEAQVPLLISSTVVSALHATAGTHCTTTVGSVGSTHDPASGFGYTCGDKKPSIRPIARGEGAYTHGADQSRAGREPIPAARANQLEGREHIPRSHLPDFVAHHLRALLAGCVPGDVQRRARLASGGGVEFKVGNPADALVDAGRPGAERDLVLGAGKALPGAGAVRIEA